MKRICAFSLVGITLLRFVVLSSVVNYVLPKSSVDSYTQAFAVQASLGRQLAPRLGVRLDASTSRFVATQVAVACPGAGRCGPPGYDKPVGLAGLTANGVMDVPMMGLPLYVIAGAGVDYFYQHPTAQGAVRADLSAGVGLIAPIGRARFPIEARFHRLVDAPGALSWVVPMTFGMRF
jgi:hypothetical protein